MIFERKYVYLLTLSGLNWVEMEKGIREWNEREGNIDCYPPNVYYRSTALNFTSDDA